MSTKLAVITVSPEEKEIKALAVKTGIELTKAEEHFQAFFPFFKLLGELSRPLADLNKLDPDVYDCETAKDYRRQLVKVRTGAEAVKDARKSGLNAEGNLIMATYNLVKNACILTESQYAEVEKFQELKDAERKRVLGLERRILLEAYDVNTSHINLEEMGEDEFNDYLAAIKVTNERLKEREAADELEKIAADKEAANLKERLAATEKELANEREKSRVEAQYNESVRRRNEELAAEKQAVIDAAAAKVKAAALAPDKEKLRALYESLGAITVPEFATDEARSIAADVLTDLAIIRKKMINAAKQIK